MENEFEVTVSQTLVKTTSVFTDNVHQCVERDYDATAGGYAYTSSVEPDSTITIRIAVSFAPILAFSPA